MLRIFRPWFWAGLVVTLGLGGSATVADDNISVSKQASLLFMALSYDRALSDSPSGTIRLAVIYYGEDSTYHNIVEAFNSVKPSPVEGSVVHAAPIRFSSVESLLKKVSNDSINIFYICHSAERSISSVLQVSRHNQVRTLGASDQMVKRGVSLAAYSVESKPRIIINLRASKLEGMDLSSELLKVSELVR